MTTWGGAAASRGGEAVSAGPFRRATPADAPVLARIFIDAWESAYPDVLAPDVLRMWEPGPTAVMLRALLATPGDTTIASLADDGTITGYIRFGPDPDRQGRGRIHSVYVAPAWSRRGFGRVLITRALDALAEQGLADVALWVFEANRPAQALYDSLGFAPDGVRRVEAAFRAQEVQLVRSLGGRGSSDGAAGR